MEPPTAPSEYPTLPHWYTRKGRLDTIYGDCLGTHGRHHPRLAWQRQAGVARRCRRAGRQITGVARGTGSWVCRSESLVVTEFRGFNNRIDAGLCRSNSGNRPRSANAWRNLEGTLDVLRSYFVPRQRDEGAAWCWPPTAQLPRTGKVSTLLSVPRPWLVSVGLWSPALRRSRGNRQALAQYM